MNEDAQEKVEVNRNVNKLIDERETAERLGCSVAALRKWRLLGRGPCYCHIGRLVRYSAADLEAFLNSHRVVTKGMDGIAL